MTTPDASDFSDLGVPFSLTRAVRLHEGRVIADGDIRPVITSKELNERFVEISGSHAESFAMSTRIFAFDLQPNDEVLVTDAEKRLPLVIRRGSDVIVSFDTRKTQAFDFVDSARPIYTYLPRFNVQMVPEAIRRPVSNAVESLRSPRKSDKCDGYRNLPLTGFELTTLLLHILVTEGPVLSPMFHWPNQKRTVFVALHDVDTDGFLQRRERDPLFGVEHKHQIRSTWFIPTKILNRGRYPIDYLLESGNEVGWHGHQHDHRDHVRPFADKAVKALASSCLSDAANFPTGMRLPKLLKSNYLFDLLEASCPALCYDTSFQRGIVPYYLWLYGRESRILEIPTTVPTDIAVYNDLHGHNRRSKVDAILEIQIARTKKLIAIGAIVCIVTHPEKSLSERPDFLDIYDQYLSYIQSCPDVWFATAGELYKYWTTHNPRAASRAA
jgi:hypothetical protein